jgi:hypothetical protein
MEAYMAITVQKITLWRAEVDNRPGALAAALDAPAKAGADLRVVMGYRHPAAKGKATIEVFPISGRKAATAAGAAGLGATEIPALLVEGDNKAGLAHRIAQTPAESGINLAFFMAHVIGRKFAAVIGLETEEDARKAMAAIKAIGKKARA